MDERFGDVDVDDPAVPGTIKAMGDIGTGYIGAVYDDDDYPWDGVARMFLDEPLETPDEGALCGWPQP